MQKVRLRCRDCGHVGLIAYCPACRGRAGGKKRTPKKLRAAREQALALVARRKARAR